MRKGVVTGLLFGFFFFGNACLAGASQISLNDFSGSETLVDFNGNYASVDNTVTIDGVSFSTGLPGHIGFWDPYNWSDFFDNIAGASLGGALADYTSDTLIEINSGSAINRVGLLLSTKPITEWSLSAYAFDGSLIETVTEEMLQESSAIFLGLESLLDIHHLVLSETGGGNSNITLMDDFRFESIEPIAPVPEPSTWVLLGTGLAGLAYYRKKKS